MEMLKKSSVLLVLIMSLIAFSCMKKAQIKGIDLDVTFSDEKLSDYLMTDMQFKWSTNNQFVKTGEDFNIFVHFWHNRNLLFKDDHIPEVLTSEWEPEKEYIYSRRIFIPTFIDEFDPDFKGEETLKLSVGFYSPYDISGKSKQEILVKKIKIFPPPIDTPDIIYEDGWYNEEVNPESFLKQWRWTSKEAKCFIDNPHQDALLVIRGGVYQEALKGQKIIFKVNDSVIDEFISKERYFDKSYDIKKEMLGDEEEFYLVISTDKSFVPAKTLPNSTDERELGIQISFIYFR